MRAEKNACAKNPMVNMSMLLSIELLFNEIVFGDVTRADLDQLIYGMLSVRMHNNMAIPECYRNGNEGGVYSEGFSEYERRKFGNISDTDLEGYNLDI